MNKSLLTDRIVNKVVNKKVVNKLRADTVLLVKAGRSKTGLSPPVKYFTCLVFAVSLCVSVYMCFVVTCWEWADLLARLWCLTVSLSLSYWYPGSGVVLDCIDS